MTDGAAPRPPNTGRIIDYWLGGTHHKPVDAEAAQGFEALFPGFPAFFKASRAYIGRAARYMKEQGVDQFLVLGAGIPDSGNVHQHVPGAKVLYSDIDLDNLRMAQQVLPEVPNVGYVLFDATSPSSYDLDVELRVLGSLERLGIIACGMLGFLSNEQVQGLFQWAYDRSPAGSYLAFDFDTVEIETLPQVAEIMKSAGPYYIRPAEGFESNLGSWSLTEEGIGPVNRWRNPEPEDVRGFFHGGVARK